MAEPLIAQDLLELLCSVDTPTVCNAIEVAQGQRGFDRYTRGTMQHSRPGQPAMVGYARTARITGLAPPTEPPEIMRARRLEYFRYMAAGDSPKVAAIEDIDHPDSHAAWWGEVHVAIHKGLGLAGAVTNGSMRDLDVIDRDFPVLAGSIGPSHGFVRVIDMGTPVTIMGMEVRQGELIHADRHGAVVIPPEVIPVLKAAIEKVVATESIVLAPAREPGFNIAKLEECWARLEATRT